MAQDVEAIIRDQGAVPATVALIAGKIHVGEYIHWNSKGLFQGGDAVLLANIKTRWSHHPLIFIIPKPG